MSIADELVLLANTKESLRVTLGLSKDVPFSQYVLSTPFTPEHLFQNSDGTITDELALLANTKENLRLAFGLSTSIPFSQYAVNMPWGSDVIPATGTVFDFKKNRYAKDGKAVYLDDISEFIRLSSATMWQDGSLVEVQNGIPRISVEGLLIEPQITNDMASGDFKNNFTASLAQVTTGVDSGLGFNYTSFVGGGGEQREEVAFGMTAVSTFPTDFEEGRGISFLVKAEAPVRYMRFSIYSTGMPITHNFNTTIDLYDGSKVKENNNFKVLNVVPMGGGWLRVDFLSTYLPFPNAYNKLNVTFGMDGEDGTDPATWTTLPEGVEVGLALPQHVTPPVYSSLTNSYGTPATRSPDILNIPLLPTQTITGDWDAGVTYSEDDGIATFTGHGYIRNITVEEL